MNGWEKLSKNLILHSRFLKIQTILHLEVIVCSPKIFEMLVNFFDFLWGFKTEITIFYYIYIYKNY